MFENEEKITAQTSNGAEESTAAGDGNADVVDEAERESAEAVDFSDKGTTREKKNDQNAINAQRRRDQKGKPDTGKVNREHDAIREAAILEALDHKNPYTGEEMRDSQDVAEYLAMKEIEKRGGDPLNDFSKYQKEKARERENLARKESEQREWYDKDREAFSIKYPDVNLNELIADKGFASFADGKVGRRPLSEIYEAYQELVGETAKQAKHMAAQMLANKNASPGSLATPDTGEDGFFTADQVRKMSQDDVKKNYDTILRSMAKW